MMETKYEQGLVSVIIPVFNLEGYVEESLKSVFAQTYGPLEIVVVDDCSTDRSSEIIKKMQKQYENIVYIKLDENSGVAVARNVAIQKAKGQYVAFLDGDDLWNPEKIDKQIKLLNSKNGGFSFTAIEMINDSGETIKGKRNVKDEIGYSYLLKNTMIATSTVLIDRNIIGDFQMPLRRSGQDYATWLMILRTGVKAYGINEALTKYRCGRQGSLSFSKTKNWKKVWTIQVENEHIPKAKATFNTICYIFNALKKYFL